MEKEKFYKQLRDFGLLLKNWFDNKNQGQEFNINEINEFIVLFEKYYNFNLKLPDVFPVPNGNIQLEWTYKKRESSLEINLKTLYAEYHELDISTNDEIEIQCNLKEKTSWKSLNSQIEKMFKIN